MSARRLRPRRSEVGAEAEEAEAWFQETMGGGCRGGAECEWPLFMGGSMGDDDGTDDGDGPSPLPGCCCGGWGCCGIMPWGGAGPLLEPGLGPRPFGRGGRSWKRAKKEGGGI